MTPSLLTWQRILIIASLFFAAAALGGEQREEELSSSTRAALHGLVADYPPPRLYFESREKGLRWINEMSARLAQLLPSDSILSDANLRREFLIALHYEASRAGLDPQLMLAVAQVESAFRKYAISIASARGYMQVMPFWIDNIGERHHNLFHLRTNLRYGAVILRHYLNVEDGDLFRALGRYNGSLGRAHYPNLVRSKWDKYWQWK